MYKRTKVRKGGRSEFNLRRWFSILSLACIGFACILSSFVLSRFLSESMLRRDGAVMLELVQSVADIESQKALAAGRKADIHDEGMRELFDHLAGVPDVLRTNIYGPDQKVIWSSERNLIGQRFDDNTELQKALKGEMEIETGVTGRSEHPKHEHMFLSNKPVVFVETYLPIRDPKRNQVIGVAELYRIPNALTATIQRGQVLIWATGILSALILYLALYWIVRRAEATIREQQSRLIESETLAAVGDMGAAVAHGIRNPLASIRTSAELMSFARVPPEVLDSSRDIMAQVDRLEHWLRDLLSYAQPDPDVMSGVLLRPILERVCDQFGAECKRSKIEMVRSLAADLPVVYGNEAAFEQVFGNIVANAIEAMPQGGKIAVSAESITSKREVHVLIRDTGSGFSEESRRTMFTAFQTSKPRGLGIGLALARRIVRRYGGEIQIDSQSGEGALILITFVFVDD
jgi:two-component system, NtrC family, sensor histidine kinase HydH